MGHYSPEELRRRYGRPCACGCGKLTAGCEGKAKAPRFTQECSSRIRRENSRARTIKAIHRWLQEFDELPSAEDWRHRVPGHDWTPRTGDVQRFFGSWNAAIAAAGFEPYPPGVRHGTRKAT